MGRQHKRSNVDKNIISHVLNSFQVLSENYDKKLEITQKWTSRSFYREANDLNFPQQPANNSTDCGVLVCMYAYAVMSGILLPKISSEMFNKYMLTARVKIGDILINWDS